MIKVGLTGNIGSGKSTVAKIFQTLEVPVFHADAEAKNLYDEPDVLAQVSAIAGSRVLDATGTLDRKALAKVIFSDQKKLQAVNKLIHPRVRERYQKWLRENEQHAYTVLEAAIMIEGGLYKQMDRLIVVSASQNIRLVRIMQRDGIEEKEIQQRMRHQMHEEALLKHADYIIKNSGKELLIPQVLAIHHTLR